MAATHGKRSEVLGMLVHFERTYLPRINFGWLVSLFETDESFGQTITGVFSTQLERIASLCEGMRYFLTLGHCQSYSLQKPSSSGLVVRVLLSEGVDRDEECLRY